MVYLPLHQCFSHGKAILLSNIFAWRDQTFKKYHFCNFKKPIPLELNHQCVLLLHRLEVRPEVSRGEIRELWKTFITNTDKTLEYAEFTRHFGYSPKSAAFPNAKMNPPKRGDSDFRMRSRKLNCAADMLQDSLRAKVGHPHLHLKRVTLQEQPKMLPPLPW